MSLDDNRVKAWHFFTNQRQINGAASLASVAMLCIAATMALGFTNPAENHPVTPVSGEEAAQPETLALSDIEPFEVARPVIRQIHVPPSRPSSLAEDSTLDSVLEGVNSRRWTDPSIYSPDRAIAEMMSSQPGVFHGVGFPDVRTYRKQKRLYNPLNPQPWSKMISWRKRDGEQTSAEPIARVRCMGLSPQAVARRADRYNGLILDYALKYKVSVSLVKAVITEESCFNNKALSPMGAQGLMQLMPATATWLKVRDPHDPEDNLEGGIRYLASLQNQFDTLELALAAYNAGPGNVRRYGGVPPFRETRAYVKKVKANYRRYAAVTRFASR